LPKANAEMVFQIIAVTTRTKSIYLPKSFASKFTPPRMRTLDIIDAIRISTNQASNKDIFNPFKSGIEGLPKSWIYLILCSFEMSKGENEISWCL
jgi:hypothetical protein